MIGMLRRREMMAQAVGEVIDPSLLFHLDGFNLNDLSWVDKIRNISFNTSNGIVDAERHYYQPSANSIALGTDSYVTGVQTFHFVLELDVAGELWAGNYYYVSRGILHNNSAGQSAALYTGYYYYIPQGNSFIGPRLNNRSQTIYPIVITSTNNNNYINGVKMSNSLSSWYPISVPSGNMILTPKNRYFDIKLYDRVLDDNEILELQNSDMQKYGFIS